MIRLLVYNTLVWSLTNGSKLFHLLKSMNYFFVKMDCIQLMNKPHFALNKKFYFFSFLNRLALIAVMTLLPCYAMAVDINTLSDQQMIRQQEQQKAREDQLAPNVPDVLFDIQTDTVDVLNFPEETPCFQIESVELLDINTMPKWLRLQYLANKAQNRCLGNEGINMLMGALQNKMIDSGYVTSRILAPEQDLTSKKLQLLVLPGKVKYLVKTEESDRYLTLFNTVPLHEGGLLDLRDIEQGLENLQRIPTAQAEINIMPGNEPGESDVVVSWQQERFWRLGASFDDSGTVGTGRYQGGLTLYVDNPLSIGDMFYISGGHDSKGSNRKGSKNYTVNYSIPFGYWSFSATASGSNYHQTVAGANYPYLYSGRSRNLNVRLSRQLYRNATQKTAAFVEVMRRNSQNYINDTEVDVQRKTTAAWKIGLTHRHYFKYLTFDGSIDYQKGNRWFGAQPLAEEISGDIDKLPRILRFSASADIPFQLWGQQFSYSPRYQRQVAKSSLSSQDRFSLGGRWSVRGFGGELSLSADNGWFVRNDLTWMTPVKGQQLYLGVDYGEVSGANSDNLIGTHLAGGVVGVKGYISPLRLSYDAFAGKPISKPKGFQTSKTTFGFNLFWEY